MKIVDSGFIRYKYGIFLELFLFIYLETFIDFVTILNSIDGIYWFFAQVFVQLINCEKVNKSI